MTAALLGFGALFVLLFVGMPLAFALGLVGYVGFGLMIGWNPSGAMAAQITWDTVTSYSLSVLPLFLLMGNLVNQAGLSRELYDASNAFVGHRKGGLATATIIACGGFAAVCGSSLATAATMASIALPSMKRYGYSDALSTGAVAAGGTLGILIPPSVIMVIYGSMTETSIGALFIAGILPGLLGVLLYIGAILFTITLNPAAGPAGPRLDWPARFRALRAVWATLALFILVIGGIYVGIFTATEAAGIGAAGAFVIALSRGLKLGAFIDLLADTARSTAMLLAVLVGALIFSNFVNVAGVTGGIVDSIMSLGLPPLGVLVLVIAFYFVLGCFFDALAMVLLTVPVFFPLVVTQLGYDPVWFGILVVVVVEIGLITPPIGMNLFVIRSMARHVPTTTIYKGVAPFIAADLIRLAVIVLLPWLVLFLPRQMAQ